jgi:hypothetical protein
MPQRCWPMGERHFIKLLSLDKESEDSASRQDHSHGGVDNRPPNYN